MSQNDRKAHHHNCARPLALKGDTIDDVRTYPLPPRTEYAIL